MKIIIFLLFFIVTSANANLWGLTFGNHPSANNNKEKSSFRLDYEYVDDLKKYYKLHKIPLSWGDAAMTCMAEGGNLYVPNSFEELTTLQGKDLLGSWIGVHDKYAEGVFYTIKGQKLSDSYFNWAKNEPNDLTKDEDCVALKNDKTYQDLGCLNKLKFTCEFNNPIIYDQNCDTYDNQYTLEPFLEKCYKLHNTPMTWHQAVRICQAENANLAFINDEREANHLKSKFIQFGLPYGNISMHIGLSDLIIQGIPMNLQGVKVSETKYNRWSSYQLENFQRCGSVTQDILFDKIDCNKRLIFMCEKSSKQNTKYPTYTFTNSTEGETKLETTTDLYSSSVVYDD
ncbi:macrophage mannose receptor 1-like [Arctopsyche grandis]|uniref:macrophage mannose receptor 1-like n=1 Tax=Arctopsyche grandis TaxID=121162 RepID=UPI00406D83BD